MPQKKTRWWLSIPVALALLVALDYFLAEWHPNSSRLPEQFSARYLADTVNRLRGRTDLVVVLGDSVLWGYRVKPNETAVSGLAATYPRVTFANLSYEGGSMPNSVVMLRYLLKNGVRPRAILANVNVKEMNPSDSAYRRLLPSLQSDAASIFSPKDTRILEQPPSHADASSRIGSFVEHYWRLYAERVDLREALFGSDDLASASLMRIREWTGSAALERLQHRAVPERFMGTYDLTPLDNNNVGFSYLLEFASLVSREHIPTLVFLTPTNHALLHSYIDDPDYDSNLLRVVAGLKGHVTVLNLDKAIPGSEFIDNDHLTPEGNRRLQLLLQSDIGRLLR